MSVVTVTTTSIYVLVMKSVQIRKHFPFKNKNRCEIISISEFIFFLFYHTITSSNLDVSPLSASNNHHYMTKISSLLTKRVLVLLIVEIYSSSFSL